VILPFKLDFMGHAQTIFAVIAAVIGIGGAYASQPRGKAANDIYRWHTVNNMVVFSAPIIVAIGRCVPGTAPTCLIGTKAGVGIPTIIYGTFQ
jgi:hypothetical protein